MATGVSLLCAVGADGVVAGSCEDCDAVAADSADDGLSDGNGLHVIFVAEEVIQHHKINLSLTNPAKVICRLMKIVRF